MRRAGWWVRMAPKGDRHWLDLAGLDHDGWWDSRPGALRSTVKRKAKKGVVDIALFTAFDADAWGDYEKIYAASWKPEDGRAEWWERGCQEVAISGVDGSLKKKK